ncbi:Pimeloyl-ACP methyl ester carboxylesterase [Leifsonia sp. 98AMF]|uniref:alpha/beta fold hydrolase n=1 Tax=unclassified Leifsonia TaxID=2663824 RepID=UPI00087DB8A1|nr:MULTISPECIES: alpha/beta hydrolase [unclassified Leifsonia]SDH61188.1 Pimeloyl-ACP methyl ester carboxylesterase [Leifsonia sp. 197AMF]SDI77975.1 Pimeloyl-ACP methyl ester carboxylesterase [Leifsonia sp. 466MF]SDK08579.1 Pimeloyl-ACP methyl ester carboxylesterase [Leifsonia sp. 157MF]SDN81404.1 Pimeloyl-ACP methyl ester carboxylesterase [Leifsonia sp. 509MF]SEN25953.1 Pimeloyl-ACP methyl ester carboxylesterase [Leifsonia sp. 467MF]
MNHVAMVPDISTKDEAVLHVEGGGVAGRPVLLLHGLGYASWAGHPLRLRLSPTVRLLSLDNRGTGRSSRGSAPISIDRFASDAATVLEQLRERGMGRTPVIGHSMGGYIAQLLAVARPDLVSHVVLVSTSGGGPTATPVPEATRRLWLDSSTLPADEYAVRTMPVSFAEGWPAQHADAYQELLAARLRYLTPPTVWREQYDACERFLEAGYDHSQLTTPALILHGSADRVVPVENGRDLHWTLPSSRYREVEGAGHALHLEHPEIVASEINDFLTTDHASNKE